MSLPVYDSVRSCPKCCEGFYVDGWTRPYKRYEAGPERLVRACPACHYSWDEALPEAEAVAS